MQQHTDGWSVIDAFMRFANLGAEWVMWLLIGLAFILLVLVLERVRLYWRTRIDPARMGQALVQHLAQDDLEGARALVARGLAMEERVLADALEVYPQGSAVVAQILASATERERQRFDRFLGFMGTLGNNAPFVGLLGTVVGIIVAFQQLAAQPKGGISVVGPGIAEALVATAVGLFVAIPAVVAFNSFKGVVRERLGNTELLGRVLLARLGREVK